MLMEFLMKKRLLTALAIGLGIGGISIGELPAVANPPLRSHDPAELQASDCCQIDLLGFDEQLWGSSLHPGGDRPSLLAAINRSLRYLQTPAARQAYQQYPIPGITRDRVQRSLRHFRNLLLASKSPAELQAAVRKEFTFYQAIGRDNEGTVDFTGYFEPTYEASRVPTNEYRYPLFRRPPNLASWPQPHPTRAQLEGTNGLQANSGPLKGLEFVWLKDRLEAFLIQVQGSARLRLTDGRVMSVGYAGRTDYSYRSIGRELVEDGKFSAEELTLPKVLEYFQQNPAELDRYLPRNNRFVFFRETGGAPARGSLGVAVTPERSIATDKSLMPPGALALLHTELPYPSDNGQLESRWASRYVLDQDTGGAIRGPGRVDIFMGTGKLAGDRAGLINGPGQIYYLLLKP